MNYGNIGSDNGLSPGRHEAIILTNAKWRPFCLSLHALIPPSQAHCAHFSQIELLPVAPFFNMD